MAYGFDANLILSTPMTPSPSASETMKSLSDLVTQRNQQQLQQATLQESLYKQQRQRSLQDLISQNSDAYSNPMARALAGGGFGDEAAAAQKAAMDRQAMEDKLQAIHADLLRSQAATVKTPEQYPAFIGRVSPEARAYYGLPEKYDAGALQSFINSGMAPDERAKFEETQRERAQRLNPDSPESQTRIGLGKMLGIPIPEGATGADVSDSLLNTGERFAATKEIAAARREAARQRGGGSNVSTDPDDPYAGMKPQQVENVWKEFRKSISTYQGRGNLNVKNQESMQRADALEALLDVPDLNKVTPQQLREASTALAGLVSRGGSQALSQIEHLTPESMASKFADMKQKLLNEPQGAEAKDFLQNMLDTAQREKRVISKQIRSGQLQGMADFLKLHKRDSKRFENDMVAAGIDPASVDFETGKDRAAQAGGGATPTSATPTHYLISPDKKLRIPAGPDGKPLPGAKAEPNPDADKVAIRG